ALFYGASRGYEVTCGHRLRAAGLRACPADAVAEVKSIPSIIVMNLKGGEGCVREFANLILKEINNQANSQK
ncbi:MAG: hypothetical protein K2H08_08525, partial [Duncaniella sp.]|nr:hypothetical protein [Duncaniella sp.]